MFASDLTTYVRDLPIIPDGLDVVTGSLDAASVRGILVMPPLMGYRGTPELPKYYAGATKIIVRDSDPEWAYNMAVSIMEALHIYNEEVGAYSVKSMVPYGLPTLYPKNDAALFESSIEFDTRFIAP